MRLEDLPPKLQEFLERFFSDGNDLKWEQISQKNISKDMLNHIRPWIEDLKNQSEWTVLPRFHLNDEIEWYALSFNQYQSRVLKENLTSFVGPTYTNFSGQLVQLNANDPIEKAVLDFIGPFSYRFKATDKQYIQNVWDSLSLMRNILKKQPVRTMKLKRPVGRILRDFEEALRQGNSDAADRFITELYSEGRLSIPNMAFLRIKYFACTGKWKELLLIPQLSAILDIPRPNLISQYIIQAIYKTYLEQFEKESNPQQAVTFFKDKLLSKYFSLFRARGPINEPDVLKAFMISFASSDKVQQDSVDKILNDFPLKRPDRGYLESLAQLVSIKEQSYEDVLIKAQHIYFDGDADLALHTLLACEPNVESTKLILRCAKDIYSLESAKTAIDFVARCSENARQEVFSTHVFAKIWEDLEGLYQAERETPESLSIPQNWVDWVKKLNEETYWASAVNIAEQGKTEWDVRDYLNNPELIDNLCDQLSYNRVGKNNDSFHNAMPHLVDFFIDEGNPHNEFKKLYLKFIELIAYD